MFVFNNCLNDARVLKEAKTLIKNGYDVEVMAMLDKKTVAREELDGVRIHRIEINPIHLRIIRFFANPLKHIHLPAFLRRKPKQVSQKRPGRMFVWRAKMRTMVQQFLADRGISIDTEAEDFNASLFEIVKSDGSLILAGIIPALAYVFFLMIYGVYRIILKFIWYFIRLPYRIIVKGSFRQLKILGVKFSRFVLQPIVRATLLPFHKYFTYYDYYKRAVKYSKSKPADVYHCHDLNTLYVGVKLKHIQPQVKLVYDSHELYLHKNRLHPAGRFKQWLLTKIETQGMHLSDRVITVGPCIADWLASQYRTETPAVILNAPHLKETEIDRETNLRTILSIKPDDFLLIYSGGITFNRGLENVIEAVGMIEHIHFVMLGFSTDEYKQSLERLISKLNIQHKVSFYGPVPHQQVASFLFNADCGIAPIKNICLSYYYCSPNKLFEFVQARLPVLASNFPEMERVVNDYNIGYTFDPDDSIGIRDIIKKMMNNPAKREEFRKNTERASAVFNWQQEEIKLMDIYNNLKISA